VKGLVEMKIELTIPFCIILTGCAYRYGTGYFTNDPVPPAVPVAYPVPTAEPATPVVVNKEPCVEEGVKTTTLEVTNQLDSKNQTIKTTAVTETHTTTPAPCD
jgi:hypothetical protein